ncbi:MAG: hydroxyethylthiazole kinase [Oscillospiraceae bacterium]
MSFSEQAGAVLDEMRRKCPLVHCITNYVTAGDTANMLLAAGASPIMADDPAETAEVSAAADALVLNMGTLSESRLCAMLRAGVSANEKGIPVVLDPVGVGLTKFRRTAAEKLLSEVKISVIRGNIAEISSLAGNDAIQPHGVDCFGAENAATAEQAARKLGTVCAVTGKNDVISDGCRTIILHNGSEKLKRVTGAGCMTTALCAAFCAVTEPLYGAAAGAAFMSICGELSDGGAGMGAFRAGLFDAAGMTSNLFCERLKADEHRNY